MGQRLQLQALLSAIPGVVKAYFQPQTNTAMEFPAIVYHWDYEDTLFAGNAPYRKTKRYMVTVIDSDPDSTIPDAVAALPMCSFNRAYVAGNLYHTVYNLYY